LTQPSTPHRTRELHQTNITPTNIPSTNITPNDTAPTSGTLN